MRKTEIKRLRAEFWPGLGPESIDEKKLKQDSEIERCLNSLEGRVISINDEKYFNTVYLTVYLEVEVSDQDDRKKA